jgi:hypothetical protein
MIGWIVGLATPTRSCRQLITGNRCLTPASALEDTQRFLDVASGGPFSKVLLSAQRGNCAAISRLIVYVAVTTLATIVLLDPLVSGTALADVEAPRTFPTTIENLRVRAEPVGLHGPARGSRTVITTFAGNGVALLDLTFARLETRLRVDVFDITNPDVQVATAMMRVSPLMRRQVLTMHITFDQ